MSKRQAARPLPTLPMRNVLTYRLSVLNALIGKELSKIHTSRSLNIHQFKVMSVMYCWPPITASGIGGVVVLDKAAISRAIASLVKLKLAERRHDPKTNSTIIVLTPAGRKMYGKMHAEFEAVQRVVLGGLNTVEQRQLFDALDRIEQVVRWPGDEQVRRKTKSDPC